MKLSLRFAVSGSAALILSTLFLVAGCESADDYAIDVSPPYSDVHEGSPRVTLSATGWSDYTWTLSNKDIGFLSATHGESVVYTAAEFPQTATTNTTAEPFMQTVTVAARNVVSTGGTNSVSHVYTGEAIIRHIDR